MKWRYMTNIESKLMNNKAEIKRLLKILSWAIVPPLFAVWVVLGITFNFAMSTVCVVGSTAFALVILAWVYFVVTIVEKENEGYGRTHHEGCATNKQIEQKTERKQICYKSSELR